MIRPGAVVAHTLTITSDGSQNCPAKAAKVEGEHLAIIAELKDKDEIDEDSDGEAEEDWSKKGSRGEPKSTKSKGKGDGTDTGSKTPKNKVKARGAWKDMAIKVCCKTFISHLPYPITLHTHAYKYTSFPSSFDE